MEESSFDLKTPLARTPFDGAIRLPLPAYLDVKHESSAAARSWKEGGGKERAE